MLCSPSHPIYHAAERNVRELLVARQVGRNIGLLAGLRPWRARV
jgi:hypothetical protein